MPAAIARTAPAATIPPDPVALLASLREAQLRADAAERAAYERQRAAEVRLQNAATARAVAEEAMQRMISHGWGEGSVREYREEVEAAEQEIGAAREAIGAARRALEIAKEQNAQACAALAAYVPPVTAEHVHEAEAACQRMNAERRRLEELLAATVEPASVAGVLQAAQAERRRLLADAAEGKGDPDALAAAETRLTALEAQAAAHARECTAVAETRAALRERIEAAAERSHATERHAKELRRLFWMSLQAEAFGNYLAAALTTRAAWLRAEAADRFARSHGLPSMAGLGWNYVVLPGACAPIGDGRYVLESVGYLRTEIERACDALRDALD